nr:iron ABC transporter permease [Marinibactrum halimedae]
MLLLLLVACSALMLGTVSLSLEQLQSILLGEGDPLLQFMVVEIRLPRVLSAIVTGAGFALAGLLMQILARNRLATPSIIGIDSASTTFVVIGLTAGWAIAPHWLALLGAFVTASLILVVARGTGTQGHRFIITGLGIGAIASAMTQLVLSRTNIDFVNQAFAWTVGSLNTPSVEALKIASVGILISFIITLFFRRTLQIMQFSDARAIVLGCSIDKMRLFCLVLSVVTTALAVSVVGPVGFISLLGPEVARRLLGQHKIPLLATCLVGSIFMILADLIGRTAFAPLELPVGMVTAIVGSPYLLWLLTRQPKGSI